MKKYEYRFVVTPTRIGLNFEKKCKQCENEWNKLGQKGWKFCSFTNGAVVFMREI